MSDSTIRQAALALYKAPFTYQHGQIWDAEYHMVADDPAQDAALRIRGWEE